MPSFGDLEPITLPSAARATTTLPTHTMELGASDLMLSGPDLQPLVRRLRRGPRHGAPISDSSCRAHADLSSPAGRRPARQRATSASSIWALGATPSVGLPLGHARAPLPETAAASAQRRASKTPSCSATSGADEHQDRLSRRRANEGRDAAARVGHSGRAGAADRRSRHRARAVHPPRLVRRVPGGAAAARCRQCRPRCAPPSTQAERQAQERHVRRPAQGADHAQRRAQRSRTQPRAARAQPAARGAVPAALRRRSAERAALGGDPVARARAWRARAAAGAGACRRCRASRRAGRGQAAAGRGRADRAIAFRDLVAGELALLDKQPEVAASAPSPRPSQAGRSRARQLGRRTRAHRAGQARRGRAAATATTLASSPATRRAQLCWREQALARSAHRRRARSTRAPPRARAAIDGVLSRPSRSERAARTAPSKAASKSSAIIRARHKPPTSGRWPTTRSASTCCSARVAC